MSDFTREEKDELQHEIIERKTANMLQRMQADIEVMNSMVKNSMDIISKTYDQTRLTNGRVNEHDKIIVSINSKLDAIPEIDKRVKSLESLTSIMTMMKDNKWLTGIIFVGAYVILDSLSLKNLEALYTWIIRVL